MDSLCGGMVKAGLHEKSIGVQRLLVTRRQAQILELAAKDLADKQIAQQLGVSLSTIRTQLGRFYRANGLHSRAGAVGLWLGARRTRS
jgi:DNA-binding NarL/FixJ family response regulator